MGGVAQMRTLVVDDDDLTRRVVAAQLKRLGHDCESVRDGSDAWRLIVRDDYRLVLSDCMMPGMNGLDLCRRIRARPVGPYVYVILLTSLGEREDRLLGLEAGADDFLPKPVDAELLAARLQVAQRVLGLL
jgi:DNA-binding response OmpR family regulator